MRLVIQRVEKASVCVEGKLVADIDQGLLILIGVAKDSDFEKIPLLAQKSVNLRIFENDKGKLHYSALDLNCDLLVVSQFTLCANYKKGRRPDFSFASEAQRANDYYQCFCEELEQTGLKVERGIFAAHMKIELINDGPLTLVIDQNDV